MYLMFFPFSFFVFYSSDDMEGVLVNPKQLQRYFKFNESSTLQPYISSKTGLVGKDYRLQDILLIIYSVMQHDSLFDENNQVIIMCDHELEVALNMKALHVCELRSLVLSQLVGGGSFQPMKMSSSTYDKFAGFYKSRHRYFLRPSLLAVVQSVEGFEHKWVFTFGEVVSTLCQYICSKSEKLLDSRNVLVVLVENDPLGTAFKVRAFHCTQLGQLVRPLLYPLTPNEKR